MIFFGRSAGYAGMLETLRAFGLRLKAEDKSCIFQQLKPIYEYRNLAEAKEHLRHLAKEIEQNSKLLGMSDLPVVFTFTGLGNVGKGALEIFDLLPIKKVMPQVTKELLFWEFLIYQRGFLKMPQKPLVKC